MFSELPSHWTNQKSSLVMSMAVAQDGRMSSNILTLNSLLFSLLLLETCQVINLTALR